jgi:aminoglycoside 6'-N-acetyltransferase
MEDAVELRGDRVLLRPAREADLPALVAMNATPSVAAWWPPEGIEWWRRQLDDETTAMFAIEVDGDLAGMVQYSEETEPDYRAAGIDLFLGPEHQDRGLGTEAVRTLARHLIRDRGHHRLTIDPAASNARAIACYRRVGFRDVGIMRRYERGADGTWHDGLLMDLLAEELT